MCLRWILSLIGIDSGDVRQSYRVVGEANYDIEMEHFGDEDDDAWEGWNEELDTLPPDSTGEDLSPGSLGSASFGFNGKSKTDVDNSRPQVDYFESVGIKANPDTVTLAPPRVAEQARIQQELPSPKSQEEQLDNEFDFATKDDLLGPELEEPVAINASSISKGNEGLDDLDDEDLDAYLDS